MGDLSVHVAKIARLRVPTSRCPRRCAHHASGWPRSPRTWSAASREIITERDVEAAIELGRDDEEMDQLRRTSFRRAALRRLGARRRGRRRHRPARPLLRADRRPRRLGRQPGRLRGHRRDRQHRRPPLTCPQTPPVALRTMRAGVPWLDAATSHLDAASSRSAAAAEPRGVAPPAARVPAPARPGRRTTWSRTRQRHAWAHDRRDLGSTPSRTTSRRIEAAPVERVVRRRPRTSTRC